jgi:hypothetical protein
LVVLTSVSFSFQQLQKIFLLFSSITFQIVGVPLDTPVHDGKDSSDEEDNIDFDDLTRRFEALKKKK